jgi:hypothetical protein
VLNVRKNRYSAHFKVIFRDIFVLVGESAIIFTFKFGFGHHSSRF